MLRPGGRRQEGGTEHRKDHEEAGVGKKDEEAQNPHGLECHHARIALYTQGLTLEEPTRTVTEKRRERGEEEGEAARPVSSLFVAQIWFQMLLYRSYQLVESVQLFFESVQLRLAAIDPDTGARPCSQI